MGPGVEQVSLYRAEIFRPLIFNVDKRPLAAAKGKVLQAGELEVVLLGIHYPSLRQVTPAGRAASFTRT